MRNFFVLCALTAFSSAAVINVDFMQATQTVQISAYENNCCDDDGAEGTGEGEEHTHDVNVPDHTAEAQSEAAATAEQAAAEEVEAEAAEEQASGDTTAVEGLLTHPDHN